MEQNLGMAQLAERRQPEEQPMRPKSAPPGGIDVLMRQNKKKRTLVANELQNILLKKNPRPDSKIDSSAETFEDFVHSSSVVADKSLFIKALLKRERCKKNNIALVTPSGTGKTMLLTMAKAFFDEKKLKNDPFAVTFAASRQFAIMREEDLLKHHKKYPTVFFRFSCALSLTARGVERRISSLIGALFDEKLNDLSGLSQDDKCFIGNWRRNSNAFNMDEWPEALNLLFKTLREKSANRNKVMVFVDDFDAPLVKFNYRQRNSEEFEKIVDLLKLFYEHLIIAAADHVELILMAGNFNFCLPKSRLHTLNMARDLSKLTDWEREILTNFGFTENEVRELLKGHGKDKLLENMDNIREKVNGYVVAGTELYNMNYVCCMLQTDYDVNISRIDFDPLGILHVTNKLFANNYCINALYASFDSGFTVPNTDFDENAYEALQKYAEHTSPVKQVALFFMRFLNATGLLVKRDGKLKPPNRVCREKLVDMLINNDFSQGLYGIGTEKLNAVTQALKAIGKGEQNRDNNLADGLKDAIQPVLDLSRSEEEDMRNEAFLQTIIGVCALRVNDADCALDKQIGGGSRKRPDVVMCTCDYALCIELKWGNKKECSIGDSFNQIARNEYLTTSTAMKKHGVRRIAALAIVVKPNEGEEDELTVKIESHNLEEGENIEDALKELETRLSNKYPCLRPRQKQNAFCRRLRSRRGRNN